MSQRQQEVPDVDVVIVGAGPAGISCLLLGGMAAGAALGYALPVGGQWLGERMDATLLRHLLLHSKRSPAHGRLHS